MRGSNTFIRNFSFITKKEMKIMGKNKMIFNTSRKIQSHTDKTGKNQDLKARAMRAAYKNKGKE